MTDMRIQTMSLRGYKAIQSLMDECDALITHVVRVPVQLPMCPGYG